MLKEFPAGTRGTKGFLRVLSLIFIDLIITKTNLLIMGHPFYSGEDLGT